jgi:hypothetical protein
VHLGNRLIAELELGDNNNHKTVTGSGFGRGNVGTTVTKRFTLEKLLKSLKYCIDLKSMAEDEAGSLRELCSDYLLWVEFDDNYVANNKGILLEQLIDKLFIE